MKIVAVTLFALFAAKVEADCIFSQGFSSGTLDQKGVRNGFDVAGGARTNCVLAASSGSNCRLDLAYGGEPGLFNTAGSDTSSNCADFTLSISDNGRQSKLGWRVRGDSTSGVRLSCSCSETVTDTGGTGFSFCFSASTLVQVQGKGEITMDSLQVGDRVLTGDNKYEPVYAFGHLNKDLAGTFYQIRTNYETESEPLEMTGNHMIFVLNEKGQQEAIRADNLKVFDKVVSADGTAQEVTMIRTITKKGMYMPLTPGGEIIVNGLKASSYTSIDKEAPQVVSDVITMGFSEQTLSHWWMSPFRMLCMGVSSQFCGTTPDQREETGILKWLISGRQYAMFAEEYGYFWRVVVMGSITFLAFAFFNIVEHVFGGPATAPLAVTLFATALYYRNRMAAMDNTTPVKPKTV